MIKFLLRYFRNYGGVRALISSEYLFFSFIISLLIYYFQLNINPFKLVASIIPNIVGFSIAAFAILLSISNENYMKLVSSKSKSDDNEYIVKFATTFSHFIIVQVTSLLISIPLSGDSIDISLLLMSENRTFVAEFIFGIMYIISQMILYYPIILIIATVSSLYSVTNILAKSIYYGENND